MKKIFLGLGILLIIIVFAILYSFEAGDNIKATQFVKESLEDSFLEIVSDSDKYRDSICENGLTINARFRITEKENLDFYKKVDGYCDCMNKYLQKDIEFIKNNNLETFEEIERQNLLKNKFLKDQSRCSK